MSIIPLTEGPRNCDSTLTRGSWRILICNFKLYTYFIEQYLTTINCVFLVRILINLAKLIQFHIVNLFLSK